MSEPLDAVSIVRIIESEGQLRLERHGLILVTPDEDHHRLGAPIVRHFCAEAVGIDRHAPPDAVVRAIELLSDRAFDTRKYDRRTA